jgi:hypothetical protein
MESTTPIHLIFKTVATLLLRIATCVYSLTGAVLAFRNSKTTWVFRILSDLHEYERPSHTSSSHMPTWGDGLR